MSTILESFARAALPAFNSMISPCDRLFYPHESEQYALVFIVGAPRSGSTLLYQVIAGEFEVAYFNSLMAYAWGLPCMVSRISKSHLRRSPPIYSSSYGTTPGIWSPSETANFWLEYLPGRGQESHRVHTNSVELPDSNELANSVSRIANVYQSPLLFKCLYLGMAIELLADIFPQAIFIHSQRPTIEVARSIYRGRIRNRPNAWWSVKPDGYERWLSMPLWQQAARLAFYAEHQVRESIKSACLTRSLSVEYSTLCKAPQTVVAQIEDALAPLGVRRLHKGSIPDNFPLPKPHPLDESIDYKISQELIYLESANSGVL